MWLLLFVFAPLTLSQYVQLKEGGPPEISSEPSAKLSARKFSAVWCDADNLYVYGGDAGDGGGRTRDFWKFEGETRRWIWFPDGPGPVGRSHMAYWNLYGKFWLYGGKTDAGLVLDDLWSFNLHTRQWDALTVGDDGPGPQHSAVHWVNTLDNSLFLLDAVERKFWSFDVVSNVWGEHAPSPGGPSVEELSPGVHYAQTEDRVYVLSGAGTLWKLNTQTFAWSSLSMLNGPGPRESGFFFPITTLDQLILFGGVEGAEMLRDLWRYDPDNDSWVELNDQTRPSPRFGASGCIDERGASKMVGGAYNTVLHNDVWRFGAKTNIHDIISSIEFNLDSATLSAMCAAVVSVFILLLIIGWMIVSCIVGCRRARRKRMRIPTLNNPRNDDFL